VPVLVALTTGQRLGIALAALAFIVFALVSSFLLPRRDPDFPGKRLPLFIVVTVALFIALVGAMVVLAHEEQEEQPHGDAVGNGLPTETNGPPAEVPGEDEDENGEEEPPPDAEQGDPEAGREVFAAEGCGNCHTFEAADTESPIAPDLDESGASYEQAFAQIRDGGGGMPPFGDQLSDEELENVTAFVVQRRAG
jgi:mono/diheme cytochrome c family protein